MREATETMIENALAFRLRSVVDTTTAYDVILLLRNAII